MSTQKIAPLTLIVHLSPDSRARVAITIEEDGLGHIDPPAHRSPNLSEFEDITRQLSARKYEIEKP